MTDVIRPLPWKEVAFDVEASLFSYMDGLENAFEEYCHQTPEPEKVPISIITYTMSLSLALVKKHIKYY